MKKKVVALFTTLAVSVVLVFACVGCSVGTNGQDGKDFDLYIVYRQLVEKGEFEGSYSEFIKQYLNVEVNWDEQTSYATAVNTSLSSVVRIVMSGTYSYKSTSFFGSPTTTTLTMSGSGVIYSLDKENGDAYILTNCHVIYPGKIMEDGVTYTPKGDLTYAAYLYGLEYSDYGISFTVVGYSMDNDVAVLKVSNSEVLKKSAAQAAVIADSDEVAVGDKVFLIGNALGEGLSATSGIVSVESEETTIEAVDGSKTITIRSMRTDCSANHGNSGGGLFDTDGKLLGLLFAGNNSDGAQGIGNVIPVNMVTGVADSIIDNCDGKTVSTVKAKVGITSETKNIRQVFDAEKQKLGTKETVAVQSVSIGSAASGKLQSGDIICSLTLGDYTKEIDHQWQISDFLWKVRSGDDVIFTVKRGDETVRETLSFGADNFSAVA